MINMSVTERARALLANWPDTEYENHGTGWSPFDRLVKECADAYAAAPALLSELCAECDRLEREAAFHYEQTSPVIDRLTADRDRLALRVEEVERDNAELMNERTFWMEACEKAEEACGPLVAEAIAAWIDDLADEYENKRTAEEEWTLRNAARDIRAGAWRKEKQP